MKKLFIFLLLIGMQKAYSQSTIRGKIYDATTGEPLAFANISLGKNTGSVSDFDGKFELKTKENIQGFEVSYIGYKSQTVHLIPGKKFYEIKLTPSAENLGTVVINGKYVNPALALMKKAIHLKKENNYQSKLPEYAYTKYLKFLVGADVDKIEQEFDTVYKNGKVYKIDSTFYKFKQDLSDKHMWLFESLIKINAHKGREKSEVIATRTAGLKKPMYEFLAVQVSGQNLYDDHYKFLFQSYLGPFSKLSFKQYRYEIDDTINLQGRPVIVVDYINTRKPLISGKIFLDKQSLAIAKLTLNTYKDFQLNAVYNFDYITGSDIWFPSKIQMMIKKAAKEKGIKFGNSIAVTPTHRDTIVNKEGDTLVYKNKKTELDYTYVRYTVRIFDVKINEVYPEKIKYDLQVHPMAYKRNQDFWERYTHQKPDAKESNTYHYIDSIAEKENIEQKMTQLKKIFSGYYPVGKYIDADFLHLLDYNLYEGFRLQLGGKTSENFSDKLRLSSYIAYGFKDKEFKYSGSLRYKLWHKTQTYFQLTYAKDLEKSGAFPSFFKSSLVWTEHHLADAHFYMQQAYQVDFSHLIFPVLKVDLNFTQGNTTTEFEIPYHEGRLEFNQKDLAFVRTNIEFTPFSKYYLAPEGRKLLKDGYPKIYLSAEKNLPGLQTDLTDYYRADVQTLIKKTYLNRDYSELLVRVGFASQGAGIDKIYQPVTNNPGGSNPLKAFNLTRRFAFETMKDYEFADNFVVSAHLQHTFQKLKISPKNDMDIRLIGRAAYGLSYNANRYTGIHSLYQTYYEAGIEFRRLLANYGLGFYYRLGAYAHPDVIDNLSIRLTINPFKFRF